MCYYFLVLCDIMNKKILITGSSGLIGSEVCKHFAALGWQIHGADSNQRAVFFGPQGDTRWNQARLEKTIAGFTHHELDIRDRVGIIKLIANIQPDAIVHTAAQPSHDRAAAIPFEDFDTNAVGTFNLLEATRSYNTNIPYVHLSTNKFYGDAPNEIKMVELESRYDYADPNYEHGISESFRIDQTKHSLFGASKVSADISVQEYGRYFNMPTACLRGGCLTGPNHTGVELHGFLSYLIKCNLEEKEYTVFGYKGKQVRDNIHSYDVARFIEEFIAAPRIAEVYNIGGGKDNSCSILEAFDLIASISGKPMKYTYNDTNRIGDHICYYSDLRKMQDHYPNWSITKSLKETVEEIYQSWVNRIK
jgi:CDP-paratose 2-epimerase